MKMMSIAQHIRGAPVHLSAKDYSRSGPGLGKEGVKSERFQRDGHSTISNQSAIIPNAVRGYDFTLIDICGTMKNGE